MQVQAHDIAIFNERQHFFLATLAAFGVAGGLLVWPVMIWSAWRGGFGKTWTLAIFCVAATLWVVYLCGLPTQPGIFAIDGTRMFASFDYAIRFLGLPWSHSHALVWPGRAIGLLILCLGIYLIGEDALTRRRKTKIERIGLGLIFFSFLVAAAAALARSNVAPEREMPIRYAMVVVLVHVGLLLASLRWLERLLDGRFRRQVQSTIFGCSLILVFQQIVAGKAAMQETARYNETWNGFISGQWTPDMEHYVHPDKQRALLGLSYLRERHLYGQ
jgi:hypothetical protein